MLSYFYVALGLAGLFLGGEALIRGALVAAKRARVSPLLAGLVIVGFGTSTPELAVSLDAVLHDQPGIAIGNIVGSNIANILFILGLCALVAPIPVSPRAIRRDGVTMVGATLLCLAMFHGGVLERIDGFIFLAALTAYLFWTYRAESVDGDAGAQIHAAESKEVTVLPDSVPAMLLAIFGGLAVVIAGSRLLLTGAVDIAQGLGLSEAIIGLTLVAVGTSTPELAISLLAALRKHADVAVGNILGSNIFNILAILGVSALVQPLPVPARVLGFDQWAMLLAAVALVAFLLTGLRLGRREGGILLAGYVAYLVLTFTVYA